MSYGQSIAQKGVTPLLNSEPSLMIVADGVPGGKDRGRIRVRRQTKG